MITASAPAKAIILGEHTALYGNPVLVMALDLRAYVSVSARRDQKTSITSEDLGLRNAPLKRNQRGTQLVRKAIELVGHKTGFDIRIKSDIPIASGLGSSAAIASALLMALKAETGQDLNIQRLAHDALECEHMVHKRSSGVDTFAVVYGGLCLYQKLRAERLEADEYPPFIIAHSGISSDTGDIVSDVDRVRKKEPKRFRAFLEESKRIVLSGRDAIREGDWATLGELMNKNHLLLRDMGVSCARLDDLVTRACRVGAYGAKLSGAGRGGVVIALVDENLREKVTTALSSMDSKIISTRFSQEGVRLE